MKPMPFFFLFFGMVNKASVVVFSVLTNQQNRRKYLDLRFQPDIIKLRIACSPMLSLFFPQPLIVSSRNAPRLLRGMYLFRPNRRDVLCDHCFQMVYHVIISLFPSQPYIVFSRNASRLLQGTFDSFFFFFSYERIHFLSLRILITCSQISLNLQSHFLSGCHTDNFYRKTNIFS